MPEENNQTPAPQAPDPNSPQTPPGTDPKPPEQGKDPSKSDEMIPKHRFDEVNQKAKELEKWKSEQEAKAKAAEEEILKKKGEFETLAKQKEEENNTLKAQLQTQRIDNLLTIEAGKAGAVDVSDVLKLIDRSGITVNEDGSVTGAAEAVTALLTAKPHLKGSGQVPTVGSPTNPNDQTQGVRRFKRSELLDHEFYTANEKEIMKAFALGMIDDDIAPAA